MSTVPALETGKPASLAKSTLAPMMRGALWAAVGFLVVNTIVTLVHPNIVHSYVTQVSATFGWIGALLAWMLSMGGWDAIIRPTFGFEARWTERAAGWRRYFEYSTDHKVIGIQYLIFSITGFLLAGLAAMLMRVQLMENQMWFFHYPQQYLSTVGIHGTVMMFSFATVIMVGGLGNYFVPMMIGSNKSAFPRLSGLSIWFLPFGYLTVLISPILGDWTTGWRGYQPLASQDGNGIIFYYLGVFAMLMSTLMVALNLTSTIIFNRAPGVRWSRLPMYAWGILTVSILNIIWVPEIMTTFVLGLLAHIVPLPFFTAVGSPLTYLELFWLFGHPEVYIVVVPAWAIWQEIMPVMGKKSLFARQWGIMGLIFVMLLSGMVWAHHMFPTMRNKEILPFSFFTEMISIPTGFSYLAVIGTLWRSKLRVNTPSVLVLMSMFNFLIGGLTGLFLADPAVNFQIHDTFFVVGHFHYTIIGGMVFAFMGGMYYWLPKLSGRMYNDKWGMLGAVWVFLAFNATFVQFFILGLRGMNRWVPVYPKYLQAMNFEVSIFAFLLGAGFLYNLIYILWVWNRGPVLAEKNPWGGKTLEWYTESPTIGDNFKTTPRVVAGFYDYADDAPNHVVLES